MHKKDEMVRIVVNLTGKKVTAYNNEGNLIELLPVDKMMDFPSRLYQTAILVDDAFYNSLGLSEKENSAFVRIKETAKGRNNIEVSTLESCTTRGEHEDFIRVFPASSSEYEKFDPDSIVHHLIDSDY